MEYDKAADSKHATINDDIMASVMESKWKELSNKLLVIIQRPSVFIVMVLFTVVMVLSL